MSKRQRLQVNQYARPTAADVTCVADETITSGDNAIVFTAATGAGTSHGRTKRGRVLIRTSGTGLGDALGVLVKTPAHEGVVDGLGGRLRDRGQRQPDSIVAMTGLVTVTLEPATKTTTAAKEELADYSNFYPLVLDKPRRRSATVLMYDMVGAAAATTDTTLDHAYQPKKRNYPRLHTANPFDVNVKVAIDATVFLGDILVADVTGAGPLLSKSAVLEVHSIFDAPPAGMTCIVVGVAMSESVPLVTAKAETASAGGRRRYIPMRVGGTVSINDSWRCFFGTEKISDLDSGKRYKQAGAGSLLKNRLECFIQPLQIHSEAGFHARIGHIAQF